MLELRDVTRAAGRELVLGGVTLTFSRDQPTAVLGLSATAREALLRLLAGADKAQSGSIKLDGKDIGQARREKGRIIRIGASGLPKSGQKVSKLVDAEAAAKVRLAGRMGAQVSDLDLDQRLRLAIARSRAEKPRLILLDAPSNGLDLEIRERFVADLKTMLADTGAVVVLVAASADEARGLDGEVVAISGGRVLQQGAAADVFDHPANLDVALATSFPRLNTLAMTAHDGRGVLADGSRFQPPEGLPWPMEGSCTLAFHPNDMRLERAGAGCLRFVVRAAGDETIGGRRFVRVTFADASWLTPQPAAAPHNGAVLNAFVERSRLMAFDATGRAISRGS
jgi:ABC-type sulfate/molybdate transport systems ATPase subunit